MVDEFGELLEVWPEMLDTFGRIGRLGRSLGVHLLLSSQRLEEGRLRGLESHLGYRIALRTFTAAESTAVLGTAAAYELPPAPGLGLLRTATGVRAFRAATTSLPAPPPDHDDPAARELVRPLAAWRRPTGPTAHADGPAELTGLVAAVAARHADRADPVCLPPLPEQLSPAALSRAWPAPTASSVVLGLRDLASTRRQEPLVVDIAAGNLAVVGSPGSGRSCTLRTLAGALAMRLDAGQLHLYVLDLDGSLGGLRRLPQTAAVADGHDPEAVRHVVEELTAVVTEQSWAAPAPAGPRPPLSLLLVDDVGRLRREHPDAEEALAALAGAVRRTSVRLALTASRWTDVRPALLDGVAVRLELRLDEVSDSAWPRALAAAVPVGPGGALSAGGVPTRLALADGREPVATCPDGRRAPAVRPLPRAVTADAVLLEHADPAKTGFLLGIRERRAAPVLLPLLDPGAHLLLLGDRGSGRTTQLLRAVRWLAAQRDPSVLRVHLVGPRRSLQELAALAHVDQHAVDARSVDTLVQRLVHLLSGPDRAEPGVGHVLVVDDHDLLPGSEPGGLGGSPGLTPLAGLLPHSADLGWQCCWPAR